MFNLHQNLESCYSHCRRGLAAPFGCRKLISISTLDFGNLTGCFHGRDKSCFSNQQVISYLILSCSRPLLPNCMLFTATILLQELQLIFTVWEFTEPSFVSSIKKIPQALQNLSWNNMVLNKFLFKKWIWINFLTFGKGQRDEVTIFWWILKSPSDLANI